MSKALGSFPSAHCPPLFQTFHGTDGQGVWGEGGISSSFMDLLWLVYNAVGNLHTIGPCWVKIYSFG